MPGSLVEEIEQVDGVARVDGNVNAFGVYVVGEDNKVVGGLGPPALGGNYTDAPAAGGAGLELLEGDPPQGEDEVVLDDSTAERAGYEIGDTVPLLTPRGESRMTPTLVGIIGFPDGGSLNGATFARVRHRDRAGPLPRRQGRVLRRLGHRRGGRLAGASSRDAVQEVLPQGIEAVTGDDAAEESASRAARGDLASSPRSC